MVKAMEALKSLGLQSEEKDEGGGYSWSLKKNLDGFRYSESKDY